MNVNIVPSQITVIVSIDLFFLCFLQSSSRNLSRCFTTMVADKESSISNLDCFLRCSTPVVPSQFLSKSEMGNLNKLWHPWEMEKIECFKLSDLWNCYDEWSVYGAGVPISVNGTSESLVQYYVPYLSAIQIFTSSPPSHSFREDTDSGDGESWTDESESDKLSSRWWDGCSSEEGGSEQENLWQQNSKLGYLYCQYFERSTPHTRVPLKDKITSLAERHPGLMSLKSVDLSPASWMAVSWYPIYSIPMGKSIKDLSTCFLTYHTLSSSFQDMDLEDDIDGTRAWSKRKEGEGIPLSPFGMVTHKMQGNLWVSGRGGEDQDRLATFLGVADSWLKQLGVQHHDFNFFTGIRHG